MLLAAFDDLKITVRCTALSFRRGKGYDVFLLYPALRIGKPYARLIAVQRQGGAYEVGQYARLPPHGVCPDYDGTGLA